MLNDCTKHFRYCIQDFTNINYANQEKSEQRRSLYDVVTRHSYPENVFNQTSLLPARFLLILKTVGPNGTKTTVEKTMDRSIKNNTVCPAEIHSFGKEISKFFHCIFFFFQNLRPQEGKIDVIQFVSCHSLSRVCVQYIFSIFQG